MKCVGGHSSHESGGEEKMIMVTMKITGVRGRGVAVAFDIGIHHRDIFIASLFVSGGIILVD